MKALQRKSTRAFMPDQAVAEPELDAILRPGARPVGAGAVFVTCLTVVQNPETLGKISGRPSKGVAPIWTATFCTVRLSLVSSSEPKFPNISGVGCYGICRRHS